MPERSSGSHSDAKPRSSGTAPAAFPMTRRGERASRSNPEPESRAAHAKAGGCSRRAGAHFRWGELASVTRAPGWRRQGACAGGSPGRAASAGPEPRTRWRRGWNVEPLPPRRETDRLRGTRRGGWLPETAVGFSGQRQAGLEMPTLEPARILSTFTRAEKQACRNSKHLRRGFSNCLADWSHLEELLESCEPAPHHALLIACQGFAGMEMGASVVFHTPPPRLR